MIFSRNRERLRHRQIAMCSRAEQGATIADVDGAKMMREMGVSFADPARPITIQIITPYRGKAVSRRKTFRERIGSRLRSRRAVRQKMGTDAHEFKHSRGVYFAPVYDFER